MSDETPEHLVPIITNRGFKHLPEIRSTYGGSVRVYESSNASGPHLWLKVEEDMPGDAKPVDGPPPTAFAHLTVEDAVRLAEQIMYLVNNHYQND